MTSLVMSSYQRSVQKGAELDDYVRRPDIIVMHLIKAGMLPEGCHVTKVPLPDGRMARSALFGIGFYDLAKRVSKIECWLDQPGNEYASPLTGTQTLQLLGEMVAHAHAVSPELIRKDAFLQGFCRCIGNPEVYEALTRGAATGFTYLIEAMKNEQ